MERQIAELYQPLFHFVKKRVNNHEDAQDLTQEVFYKLAISLNDDVKSVKSWLYTIARNIVIDYYRSKKRIAEDLEVVDFAEEPSIENVACELSKCIVPFINKLPDDYKTLITLSELEDVPQKEIAERLDMNYVTVRSKVQRGRKKLKEMFVDCCTIEQGGKGSLLGYKEKNGCQPTNKRGEKKC